MWLCIVCCDLLRLLVFLVWICAWAGLRLLLAIRLLALCGFELRVVVGSGFCDLLFKVVCVNSVVLILFLFIWWLLVWYGIVVFGCFLCLRVCWLFVCSIWLFVSGWCYGFWAWCLSAGFVCI